MRQVRIESFTDIDDAWLWAENVYWDLVKDGHEDIQIDIHLIDGKIRAGVITDSRQGELNV